MDPTLRTGTLLVGALRGAVAQRLKTPSGGSGEATASASWTGRARPAKRSRSAPATTRPGIGSAAQRRTSPARGSGASEATATRLPRSEEDTSELQRRQYLVCRLLLE